MHSVQQFANAMTMLLPSCVILYISYPFQHTSTVLVLLGTLMHLPASFAHHMRGAFDGSYDLIDNDLRRLDQSLQHTSGAIFVLALSGLWAYGLVCFAVNCVGVLFLWKQSTSNDGLRWIPINICVHLYLAPMLWRGDYDNCLIAFLSFWIGGVLFVPWVNERYLNGWGHPVFHMVLTIHMYAVAVSSLSVNGIS